MIAMRQSDQILSMEGNDLHGRLVPSAASSFSACFIGQHVTIRTQEVGP